MQATAEEEALPLLPEDRDGDEHSLRTMRLIEKCGGSHSGGDEERQQRPGARQAGDHGMDKL